MLPDNLTVHVSRAYGRRLAGIFFPAVLKILEHYLDY
jgi:hypothetical protein